MTLVSSTKHLTPEEKQALVKELLRKKARQHQDFPVSFAQERLWFLDQLEPGSTAYTIAFALHITGALDVAALERSFAWLIARHEVLRTTFPAVDSRPVQRVAPAPATYPLAIDVQPGADLAAVRALLDAAVAAPFDLANGPLLRVQLVQRSATDWALLLVLHHAITDGWSTGVLVRDLLHAYQAFQAGREPELPPLPIQYADVAKWQRATLQGDRRDQLVDFWRTQLRGAPALLTVPTDRPRPPVQDVRGAAIPVLLPAPLVAQVRALAQQTQATLFQVLLASWQVLLGRLSVQDDVVVGTPIANRTRSEVEGLIGMLVNTLPLRTDLRDNPPFRSIVQQVRQTTLDAYAHQDLPFEQIVDAVQPARSLSYAPLVQVLFALQNAPQTAVTLPGLLVEPLELSSTTTKFDLTLALTETETGALRGALEYVTALFDESTVQRLIDQWLILLAASVARPDTPINALPLARPEEHAALLARNPGQAVYPVTQPLHAAVARHAAVRPDALALRDDTRTCTYAELEARTNQLARILRQHGVTTEVRVGICLERSLAVVEAIVAVLKAGGAYVPLDPHYPAERLTFLAQNSQAAVVLTSTAITALDRATVPGAVLEWEALDLDAQSSAPLDHVVDPQQAAYIIYTSGSTGQPKGVVITHAHVARLLDSTERWYRFGPDDVWALYHSYAFDMSVWEIWGALYYGGRLEIVPYTVSRSPDQWLEFMVERELTVLNQTPSAFRQLQQAALSGPTPAKLPPLRIVTFGGEALDIASLETWFDAYGDERPLLVNKYGITETTVHTTYRPVTMADVRAGVGSLIGVAMDDLALYVLDAAGHPVPVGVPGELYVGGVGVARCYHARPALTAQRMLPDPFIGRPGARMYRSGDIVRYRADGDLEYLGRADHQVKLRGFRIELGEITSVLSRVPGVTESAVILRHDAQGLGQLVAYVSGDTTVYGGIAGLHAAAVAALPEYMVPGAWVEMERLPLTAHGKLDRRALPEPSMVRLDLVPYVAPRTPVEAQIAQIWAAVLGLEQVGVHDSFFALGGDSIRSVQVIAKVRAAGLSATLQDVFRHPTVAEFAALVAAESAADAMPAEDVPLPERGALLADVDRARMLPELSDAYPLTQLQLGMLYHMQRAGRGTAYHNVDSFHVHLDYDHVRFQAAVDTVVARHPILRTRMALSGYTEPVQEVLHDARLVVGYTDLRGQSDAAQEQAITAYAQAEHGHAFAPGAVPLLRLHVHQRDAATVQITVTEFHPILDGWSLHTIFAEVLAAYAGAELPPVEGRYSSFVALEQAVLADPQARDFWASTLADYTRLALPFRDDAAPTAPPRFAEQRLFFSAEETAALHSVAERLNVPLKTLLLTAHVKALSVISGQRDVLTGVVTNGRPETVGAERICGLFLNTVPFRIQLAPTDWAALVQQVWAHECALLPFRRYPLAAMQQAWGDGAPLFEVAFNYTNFHVVDAMLQSDGVEVEAMTQRLEETHFPLSVNFGYSSISKTLALIIDYNQTLLDAAVAERLQSLFHTILTQLAAELERPHDRLAPLTADERTLLLDTWNATTQPLPAPAELFARLREHAQQRPHFPAITGVQTLAYAELEARSNQLARLLQSQGVCAEQPVLVYLERSADLLVAFLAVLKAGGAYVPLDPKYASERSRHICAAARPVCVLTTGQLAQSLPALDAPLLCLDTLADDLAQQSRQPLDAAPHPEQTAYIIFTSGSTGQPKGVAVPHRGLLNLAQAQIAAFAVAPTSRVLQAASIGFDAAISEFLMALVAGATLVLPPSELLLAGQELLDVLRDYRVSVATIVPSVLVTVPMALLPHLRTLIVAGEACPPSLVRQWSPGRLFVNAYGPTETTVCATLTPWDDGQRAPLIGGPIANTQVYVLDAALQPVPVGVEGDLYVAGASLARGYLDQPALTAARFIPNPFATQPGARMYATGDRARFHADGRLEYRGRADQQVKLRGFRVELGEIEHVLAALPGVRESAVVLHPAPAQLVAYVVRSGQAPADDGLRAELAQRLPEYMLPAEIITLDALPRTPNGKLDRRALPAPTFSARAGAAVLPRDRLELELAQLWESLLNVRPIGVHDEFFALGGHSLLAVQLTAAIAAQWGRPISSTALFEHTTIAALAEHLQSTVTLPPTPLVPLQPHGRRPPLVLIHGAGGNAFRFMPLLAHIAPDQPVFALQAQDIPAELWDTLTIEELAADYLAAIRARIPGPFHVAGWSIGGLIAYALRELAAASKAPLATLTLIDTWAPAKQAASQTDVALLQAFCRELGLPQPIIESLLAKANAADLSAVLEQAQHHNLLPPTLHGADLIRQYQLYCALVRASERYAPPVSAQPLTLVRAANPLPDQSEGWRWQRRGALGWSAFVGKRVETQTVPGNHYTLLLEPAVRDLAATLTAAITQSEE